MSYLPNKNKVSTVNSTATPLNSGQTFTGTVEDGLQYDSLLLAVSTDQNGTFTVQFSNDGTNWDSTLTKYYRTTDTNAPHRYTITRRYFRVTFTNTSASNQTYLRLQTIIGAKAQLNAPLDATISQNFDSIPVRPTDFRYEAALGRRQNTTTWNKFGYNDDIDIGTETVWSYGGTWARIDTAGTMTVTSTSVEDKLTTGTGAWNVVIYYVDANREAKTVVVPLNGTSNVTTTETALGINRVALYNTGSNDINVGVITVRINGTVQASIPASEGATQQAIFFTQSNHTTLMDWMLINIGKTSGGASPKVTLKGWVYSYVSTAKYLVFRQVVDTSVENTIELKPSQPFVVGEKSIFWLEATTNTNDTAVSARFSLIEVRNI